MRNFLILFAFSILVFLPGNDILSLTHPDEVFYTQTAREMVQQNSWNVPYLFGQPQFEKPILTYWLLRIGYLLLGETSFGARFFPSLFAIIGVLAVYWFAWIGFRDQRKAWLSALILMSSGLYVGLGRMVFTDTIFSVFILLSLTAFFWAHQESKRKFIGVVLTFIFSALAVLTKGPLGFLIPVFVVIFFLAIRRELNFIFDRAFLIGFVLFLLIALPWYVFIIQRYGMVFIQEFFYNDHIRRVLEAEHGSNDTWYFYPMTMFGCMFPWTFIVAAGLVYCLSRAMRRAPMRPAQQFLLLWIGVVFAVFQVAHSKLVSYIVPLFPALAIISGDFLDGRLAKGGRDVRILLLISTLFLLVLPAVFIWGLFKYPIYLPSKEVVAGFIVFYLCMIAGMLAIFRSGRLLWNVCLLALQVPVMLGIIFLTHSNFEDYASCKSAVDYLSRNYKVEGRFLCTKMFVRGVYYFSNRDVVAMTLNSKPFFSPHPILNLDTEERVLEFLKAQSVTYGFVSKAYWGHLQRLAAGQGFQAELLRVIGDKYVVRVAI